MEENFKMLAKTFYGFEEILEKELQQLGAQNLKRGNRFVSFEGDKGFMYKANLCLRTALKILKPIHSERIQNEESLYKVFYNFPWEDHIDVNSKFVIDSVVNGQIFTHSQFVSQKAKDGIVDQFRDRFSKRPTVDLNRPDLRINLHINNDYCTISLDTSGASLHQRGYRTVTNIAPLNEVLAAGLIQLSGWQANTDFLDPMCGSGTFLIEAAMIAQNYPPNYKRTHFLFKNWKDFDSELFDSIKKSVINKTQSFDFKIYGYDKSPLTLKKAILNIKEAGFEKYIVLKKEDFFFTKKDCDKKLQLIFNPPYGERLSVNVESFYKNIGDTLKKNYTNSIASFITSNLESLKHVGLKHKRRIKLYNGKLESRLVTYELYKGSKKNKT